MLFQWAKNALKKPQPVWSGPNEGKRQVLITSRQHILNYVTALSMLIDVNLRTRWPPPCNILDKISQFRHTSHSFTTFVFSLESRKANVKIPFWYLYFSLQSKFLRELCQSISSLLGPDPTCGLGEFRGPPLSCSSGPPASHKGSFVRRVLVVFRLCFPSLFITYFLSRGRLYNSASCEQKG